MNPLELPAQLARAPGFGWAFVVFLGYYVLQAIYSIVLSAVGLFEERRRQRQDQAELYASLTASSFAIPLSVILPAHNEELWIEDSVMSVLNQRYAQLEIIIVDDGSTDRTMDILRERFDLEHVSNPYKDHFKSGKLKGIYRSRSHPNLSVLCKEKGGKKAGTVNAGINIAKYKFVCVMDTDTVLEEDALLKVMAHIQKDPARIIGIGSYFGLVNGFEIKQGRIVNRRFNYNPVIAYQNLEYIRTFIGNRIAWSRWNVMPNIAGGFGVWRRDVLMELGGYNTEFSSEDMELTFRAHDYMARHSGKGYRIEMLPYCIGWTEGPGDVRSLIKQRNRWHRVVLETIWHYRRMLLNPRYGWFGFITIPYFLLYECLGLYIEMVCYGLTAWGFFNGFIDGWQFAGIFVFMILVQSLVSLIPMLTYIHDQRLFRVKDSLYLTGLSFLELLWYRWLLTWAKIQGTFDYFRGFRDYDMVARNRATQI